MRRATFRSLFAFVFLLGWRPDASGATPEARSPDTVPPVRRSERADASIVKRHGRAVTRVRVVRCGSGKAVVAVPRAVVRDLRRQIAKARVTADAAVAPPAWDVVFELQVPRLGLRYAQLINDHTLRVSARPDCPGPSAGAPVELMLPRGETLYAWLEKQLGGTTRKEYQTPRGAPSLGDL